MAVRHVLAVGVAVASSLDALRVRLVMARSERFLVVASSAVIEILLLAGEVRVFEFGHLVGRLHDGAAAFCLVVDFLVVRTFRAYFDVLGKTHLVAQVVVAIGAIVHVFGDRVIDFWLRVSLIVVG